MSVSGLRAPEAKRGRAISHWPPSYCWDQTSRVGQQDEAERKRFRVLAEKINGSRQSPGWSIQADFCASSSPFSVIVNGLRGVPILRASHGAQQPARKKKKTAGGAPLLDPAFFRNDTCRVLWVAGE